MTNDNWFCAGEIRPWCGTAASDVYADTESSSFIAAAGRRRIVVGLAPLILLETR